LKKLLGVKLSIKLAIASSDGKVVNQHFGHARVFHVVEVNGDTYQFLETRDVPPSCGEQGHSTDAFDAVLTILDDCDGVIVAQIGIGASEYVINHGLRIFECRGLIDDVLQELIANHL
jgi:predicted Fe-Mo cluster-binding NifX family protein